MGGERLAEDVGGKVPGKRKVGDGEWDGKAGGGMGMGREKGGGFTPCAVLGGGDVGGETGE